MKIYTKINTLIFFIFLFIGLPTNVVSQTVIFSDDFETDKGWTFTGEFERDTPSGLGGEYGEPDPGTAVSGSNVLGTDLTGEGTNL